MECRLSTRSLYTQAAALKLDLNGFKMCLSMSPITRTLNFFIFGTEIFTRTLPHIEFLHFWY